MADTSLAEWERDYVNKKRAASSFKETPLTLMMLPSAREEMLSFYPTILTATRKQLADIIVKVIREAHTRRTLRPNDIVICQYCFSEMASPSPKIPKDWLALLSD